jgi:hypothetical protein
MALCMYVRREMSTLTESDLDATMDAMYTMWSVESEKGQALYGDDYHAASWFTEAHVFNAAQRDSDHIHEGQGFLFQHLKMSNMFEQSMQAVDPSVSLSYWDYTAETSLVSSYIFQSNTIGSISLTKKGKWEYRSAPLSTAAIPDGRWAKAHVFSEADKFEDLTNSYGYMRGPWNSNPSPYISRFITEDAEIPGCASFYSWLTKDSLSDFMYHASFGPHASVHGSVGGLYGCDVFNNQVDEGLLNADSTDAICGKWTNYMKELYRSNDVSPIDSCYVADLDSEDGFNCGYLCSSTQAVGKQLMDLIDESMVPDGLTSSDWSKWGEFICKGGDAHRVFSGDHLEAGSPTDPSFWPIHPNLERLYHAKKMAGGFGDSKWPTDVKEICDKHSCYEQIDSEWVQDNHEQCCYGHYHDDQLLDFVEGDVSQGYGPSNREYETSSDPTSRDYSLNYVYDKFTWDHCSEDYSAYYITQHRMNT